MITGKARRGWGWVCGGLVVMAVFLALAFAPVAVVRAATVTVPDCMGSSLATAISNAGAGDTITFAQDCPTATPITLTSTQTISKNLTLDGTGHQVTISGGNTVQLFVVNNSRVTFTVTRLTLTGGNTGGIGGGGIDNEGGTLTVTNSTLSGNSATGGYGGGIFNNGGTLTVTNSTLSGNSAHNGGGIYNAGTVTLTNSTLATNSADYGGGIFNNFSTVTVTNSTLSGNSAAFSGGGIVNYNGTANAANTLIVNSTNGDVFAAGINGTNTKNITGSFTFATPLQGNGGPTATLALPPGSPALGGGDLATCTAAPVSGKDQRGLPRPDPGTTACDIGAFESQGFTLAKTSGDAQSAAFGTAFAPLTATVTSKDAGVTVNNGTLTFVILPGTSSAAFGAAGGTGCTVSTDKLTASGCTVNAMGVATSPPFTGTVVGGFTVTASATLGDAPEATYTETVTQATPTVGVTSGTNPSTFRQSVTFTATVTGVSGTAPTGSVQFAYTPMGGMSTPLGSPVMLTAGMAAGTATATLPTTALPVGTDTITAAHSGDGNYTAGTPGTVVQTVSKAATTVAVTSGTNPSTFGQSVTFTATVTGVSGTAPTGTVQFSYTPMGGMSTPLGSPVMLTAGMGATATASLPTTALPIGMNSVTATYSGDGSYTTSNGTVTQTVSKAGTTIAVMSDTNPSTFGQSVTFTASVRVAAPGAGTPTGTVAFTLGSTALGNGTVNGSGVAALTTTALPVGANQTITATYSGNANFATSNGTTTVTVNPVTIILTAPTGTGSGNSGTGSAPGIRAGGSITLGANPNTGITYTSSNPSIATVDPTTGVVTGISAGTVTITASGPNGSSGSIVVTITGGTGGGLVAPAPMAHPAGVASTPGAGGTPVAQPTRRADSAGSSGSGSTGGVQPQAAGGTAAPSATPGAQPARR